MKKTFTLLMTLLALSVSAWATTVTWDANDVATVDVYMSSGYGTPQSQTIDGITVTAYAPASDDYCHFLTPPQQTPTISTSYNGQLIFAPVSGMLTSIVITCGDGYASYYDLPAGSGWSWDNDNRQLTWSGNATSSVILEGDGSSSGLYFQNVQSVEFTVVPASGTVVAWDAAMLPNVNVSMGDGIPGDYITQTFDGITVSVSAPANGDLVDFYTPVGGSLWIHIQGNGKLTFAPESGKSLTSIVISCAELPYNQENLKAGTGWAWDPITMQLRWSGAATSVNLECEASSSGFYFYDITSIVYIVDDSSTPVDPTPQASTITWDATDLESVHVNIGDHQTIDGIKVTNATDYPAGEYCHFFYDDTYNHFCSFSMNNGGKLIFAPESGQLTSIVITCDIYPSDMTLASGWTWDSENMQLKWSGAAASSVVLHGDNSSTYFGSGAITSIEFTVIPEEEPDTREVPEFRFTNGRTEATIVKDIYGWIFEPGQTYEPLTEYSVEVLDGVFYYQGQPYENWVAPSQAGLPMTYSVTPNNVITLTATEGDSFSFNVVDYGDAVITISTVGNEQYQPASVTFTIHVINGKSPTREGTLVFAEGPRAGEVVPDDYVLELLTGQEVPKFELREKRYPQYSLAPCYVRWGSQNYYIASVGGENKLRALTAGNDVFTVTYSRYPDGEEDGSWLKIEIPAFIASSMPAMTSSLSMASNPASDPNLVFNANYDGVNHNVKVNGVLSNEDVKYVMDHYAYGSQEWINALPNSISFELPAGKGSFSVTCRVRSGYELRVLKFGDKTAKCFTNTDLRTHVIEYDITDQRAVVIYVVPAGSPNNALKRVFADEQDSTFATLTALDMNPIYPIVPQADPDSAGVYYSTHYNKTQNYLLPAGTEAYVATVSGSDLMLNKVAEGGQVIPADEAFILKSSSDSIVLTPTSAEAVSVTASNDLIGTDMVKEAPENCYMLSDESEGGESGIGFYAFSGTIPSHKAYLLYSGAEMPQKMNFLFGVPTAIENTQATAVKNEKRLENGQLIIIRKGVKYNAAGQVVK